MRLIYGADDFVIPWVCSQIDFDTPELSRGIGIASQDKLIGGCVYSHQYLDKNGKPFSIEMTIATIDKRWASKAIIYALLGYPFLQLGVRRVQSTVSRKNRHVRQFLERIGFKLEGIGRQAWKHGGDACVYSMLSGEFLSSRWNLSGKISS